MRVTNKNLKLNDEPYFVLDNNGNYNLVGELVDQTYKNTLTHNLFAKQGQSPVSYESRVPVYRLNFE